MSPIEYAILDIVKANPNSHLGDRGIINYAMTCRYPASLEEYKAALSTLAGKKLIKLDSGSVEITDQGSEALYISRTEVSRM